MKIKINGCNKVLENSQIGMRIFSEKEENELFVRLDNFDESKPILKKKAKDEK